MKVEKKIYELRPSAGTALFILGNNFVLCNEIKTKQTKYSGKC